MHPVMPFFLMHRLLSSCRRNKITLRRALWVQGLFLTKPRRTGGSHVFHKVFRVESVDERYIFGGKCICNVKIQQMFTVCNYFSSCAIPLWPKYALKLLRLNSKHKRTQFFLWGGGGGGGGGGKCGGEADPEVIHNLC